MKTSVEQESRQSEAYPAADKPAVRGQCLCGKVSYTGRAAIRHTAVCHCRSCQRQTGSAFSTIAAVPAGSLLVQGEPAVVVTPGQTGLAVRRYFCRDCGSPLYSHAEAQPALFWLKTGCLDVDCPRPAAHIWWADAQPWIDSDFAALPKISGNPPA